MNAVVKRAPPCVFEQASLARHVRDHKENAAIIRPGTRPEDYIVVVSRDCVRGASGVCNLISRKLQRRARQKPGLDVPGNFQIALHDHAVGQFEQQDHKHQQATPQPEVELDYPDLAGFVSEGESTHGKHQQDQRKEEQDSARWRELFQNRPEQRFGDEPVPPTADLSLCALAEPSGIEAVT